MFSRNTNTGFALFTSRESKQYCERYLVPAQVYNHDFIYYDLNRHDHDNDNHDIIDQRIKYYHGIYDNNDGINNDHNHIAPKELPTIQILVYLPSCSGLQQTVLTTILEETFGPNMGGITYTYGGCSRIVGFTVERCRHQVGSHLPTMHLQHMT